MSGSCALLILYNPLTRTVYTACTGDSRAILAQQHPDGIWAPIALSTDQSGDNEEEKIRLQREHPGEELIRNGRFLRMGFFRAFADFPWRSSWEVQDDLGMRFCTHGAKEKTQIPTPPYLTARPVVTVTKVKQPSVLVLATDGLWHQCTNEEVVELVVQWMEAQPGAAENKSMTMTPTTMWWKKEPPPQTTSTPGFDFRQCWDNDFETRFYYERTTLKDLDNVAVHLLRNACGGNHTELLAGTLAARHRSRGCLGMISPSK